MPTEEAKKVIRDSVARSAKSDERMSGSTTLSHWGAKQIKTVVTEFNKRTGDNIELKKVGNTNKAFDKDGNEISKAKMIQILTDQNETMQAQATTGIQ